MGFTIVKSVGKHGVSPVGSPHQKPTNVTRSVRSESGTRTLKRQTHLLFRRLNNRINLGSLWRVLMLRAWKTGFST